MSLTLQLNNTKKTIFRSQHIFRAGIRKYVSSKTEPRDLKAFKFLRETYAKYPNFILPSLAGVQTSIFLTSFSTFIVFPSVFDVVSLNFTISYALCAALRQVTLPLDILTASILIKLFPFFKEVKLLELYPINMFFKSTNTEKPSKLRQIVNKYGLGYLVASRYNNAIITLCLWYCIEIGYDTKKILVETLHLEVQTVDKVAPWFNFYSATITATDILLPATLLAGFSLANRLGRLTFR